MAEIQALFSCLDVFARAPDKASLDAANIWLQNFQHSVNSPFTSGPIMQPIHLTVSQSAFVV
jgi:transportin-3